MPTGTYKPGLQFRVPAQHELFATFRIAQHVLRTRYNATCFSVCEKKNAGVSGAGEKNGDTTNTGRVFVAPKGKTFRETFYFLPYPCTWGSFSDEEW